MPVGMGKQGLSKTRKKVEKSWFTNWIILTSKGKKRERIKDNPKFAQTQRKKKKSNNSLTSKVKQHSKCVLELESPGVCICNDNFWVFSPNTLNQNLGGWELRIYKCAFYLFTFGHTWGMWKFPGQGSKLCLSSDPNHRSNNTGSFTHCNTRTPKCAFYKRMLWSSRCGSLGSAES